jgi:hypothetical protein
LRFAITGSGGPTDWNAAAHRTTAPFKDMYVKARSPKNVKSGDVLTTWISIEVERSPDDASTRRYWEGALYTHGFFFAHEAEDLSKFPGPFKPAGLKDPGLREDLPFSTSEWVRR